MENIFLKNPTNERLTSLKLNLENLFPVEQKIASYKEPLAEFHYNSDIKESGNRKKWRRYQRDKILNPDLKIAIVPLYFLPVHLLFRH